MQAGGGGGDHECVRCSAQSLVPKCKPSGGRRRRMAMPMMLVKPSSIQPEAVRPLVLISFKVGRKKQKRNKGKARTESGRGQGGQMKRQTPRE